jgi:hypothetical protein
LRLRRSTRSSSIAKTSASAPEASSGRSTFGD